MKILLPTQNHSREWWTDRQTDRQSETNIYPHQENEKYNYHKNSTFMSIVTDHNINNHIFIQE